MDKEARITSVDKGLADLLERSKMLKRKVDPEENYVINRNPSQIDETARRLARKSVRGSDEALNRGRTLLSAKGFDTAALNRDLNKINLKTAFEPLRSLDFSDVAGFLKHEHDTIISTAIEESKKECISRYEEVLEDAMHSDWERDRTDLLESLGEGGNGLWGSDFVTGGYKRPGYSPHPSTPGALRHRSSPSSAALLRASTPYGGGGLKVPHQPHGSTRAPTPSTPNASGGARVNGEKMYHTGAVPLSPAPSGSRGRSKMDAKMLAYAQVVKRLVKARHQAEVAVGSGMHGSVTFALVNEFRKAAGGVDAGRTHKKEVLDSWELLRHMIEEERHPPEGSYLESWRRGGSGLRRQLVRGARSFLEMQFRDVLKQVIVLNHVRRGGEPGVPGNVPAFWRALTDRNRHLQSLRYEGPLVNDTPVWVRLYFYLRAGAVREACAFAENEEYFDGTTQLPALLRSYMEEEEPTMEQREHCTRLQNGTEDHFKKATLALLGGITLPENSKGEVMRNSLQDTIWLHLHTMKLGDLQTYVMDQSDYAEHRPMLYFQVLLLTQQFVPALQFLMRRNEYFVDGLHYGAALHYYGLLHEVETEPSAPYFFFDGDVAYCNFIRILRKYVSLFSTTDPLDAANYFFLLRDGQSRFDCLKNLVLDTKEFDVLLGSMGPNGIRRPGVLQDLVRDEEALRDMTNMAARQCEKDGYFREAVALYTFARNATEAMGVLTKRLSQLMTSTGNKERAMLQNLAQQLSDSMARDDGGGMSRSMQPSARVRHAFQHIRHLLMFFDAFNAKQMDQAMRIVRSLDLLPPTTSRVTEMAERFRSLDKLVQEHFPNILITTMRILHALYQSSNRTLPKGGDEDAAVLERRALRDEAQALVAFAGKLELRMMGDTYASLIRLEHAML